MHCRADFRVQLTRWLRAALILPLILLGVSFGQKGDAGTKEDAPVKFVNAFSADGDVNGNRTPCQHVRDLVLPSATPGGMAPERPASCDEVLNIVAGKRGADPDSAKPIVAGKVAVDSNLRVLITEPTSRKVHILDFKHRKYLRIDGAKGDRMTTPYGIAVDAENNIYVTDLGRGRIAVYNPAGKFLKFIGDLKGEGLFQNPQAIAIDRATGRIYLADTSRDFILILDRDGKILSQLGKRGGGSSPAEFKQPTDIDIYEHEVYVLDRENARIQVLDLDGNFVRQFHLGGGGGDEARGIVFDSQGRLFVPSLNWVEAFNREGKLLFRFGKIGNQQGEFQRPSSISRDAKDRLYVVDSGNQRIQVFQAAGHPAIDTETAR